MNTTAPQVASDRMDGRVRNARLCQPLSQPSHLRCPLRDVQKVIQEDDEERKRRFSDADYDHLMRFHLRMRIRCL